MQKKQTFWTDSLLTEQLATIPRSEKSTVIRMALREYFINAGNVNNAMAQQVAKELIRNLKGGGE